MEESFFDMMERMEGLVPEYSYSSVEQIVRTDGEVRDYLIRELKQVKELLFHVVQVSYELQRDKLSEAVEVVWDGADSLVDRVENAKTSRLRGSRKHCDECKKRIEQDLRDIVRRDRELILEVKDLKRTAYLMYRALLEEGRERHFIKNLDKIKKYVDRIYELMEERDRVLMGE